MISLVVYGSEYDVVQDPEIISFYFDLESRGPRAGFDRSEIREWADSSIAERCWFPLEWHAWFILFSKSREWS